MKDIESGKQLVVLICVVDILVVGNDPYLIHEFKHVMTKEFEMFDLGGMCHFFGMDIKQVDSIFISQKKYASGELKNFKMEN